MDTAITILIFGIVGLSALACLAALWVTVGPRGDAPRREPADASLPVETPADEAWSEAQAVVAMRNARRRRRGEPERDPDAEAAEILRTLEDGSA